MDPIKLQDPGSADVQTITLWDIRTAGTYYELGEFLASRLADYWPQQMVNGVKTSVDQAGTWRSQLAEVTYSGAPILICRHTSSNDHITAVAAAKGTGNPNEAEVFVCVASYDGERVQPVMMAALRQECFARSLVLGKAKMVRTWEPI